ncbi:MAG: pallilysin-related adhesin [Treponema sp.]|nr:pallilysin-related adhesin [Treponema sp.]
MQKRIVIVSFIIAAAAIVLLALNRGYFQSEQQDVVRAKLVVPSSVEEKEEGKGSGSILSSGVILSSFINLNPDETLLDVISSDFTGDGFEDQVNVVRKAGVQNLQLVVAVYNPKSESYERTVDIATQVEQVKTFSCYGIDLTGRNKPALVYQGFDSSGNSVLRAFFINYDEKAGIYRLMMLADLKSNGAIYLQQLDDDNYATGTGSLPYIIMMYSSEVSKPESSDQIQTVWSWSAADQKYVQTKQSRIKGSSIKKGELAKIQDGTVKTFADYLGGLWYRTETNGSGIRYVFFDYESEQIIFLIGDEEEVYNWQNSTLHYRGMYISTTNYEIETLKRNVDVSLVDLEQIAILVHDDVSMAIKDENSWNGDYKKMKFSDFYSESFSYSALKSTYIYNLESGPSWRTGDGNRVSFADGFYNLTAGEKRQSGSYVAMQLGDSSFIQFKAEDESSQDQPLLNGCYLASYPPSADDGSQIDEDRIILQPYTVQLYDSYPSSGHPVILTREKSDS